MTFVDYGLLVPIGIVGNVLGAIACIAAAVWILRKGDRARRDRRAAIVAVGLTGVWAGLAAALTPSSIAAEIAESARNLALIYLLLRLFANDGRDASVRPIRPLAATLIVVELLQLPLLLTAAGHGTGAAAATLAFQVSAVLHLLVTIGALVLLHNLYGGAATQSRQLLRWSAVALAGNWIFDLNLHLVAYLSAEPAELLLAARGLVVSLFAIVLALGCHGAGAGLQFHPSRAVAFRSLSLMLIGGYLLVMVVVTRSLALLGGDLGRATQFGFLIVASAAAIVWLPSARVRGWLRVMFVKHLFRHRYDYREEWLRFTQTIGRGGATGESLHERAVRAMADITDSPAGVLLVPNEEAELELVARWQWPAIEVPSPAADYRFASRLERSEFIFDIDALRARRSDQNEAVGLPQWLLDVPEAWAAVPLIHFERLVGVVVLARPAVARSLDWEDFDLLRAAGRQLASYLAEQTGQAALMEAARFEEFNRRIAFVMHDIKNLASQLTLLARNAERHAENPEFRADMLITLRNSADKLHTLLARLGRYGTGKVDAGKDVDLAALAKLLVQRFNGIHPVQLTRKDACIVKADAEALEQALQHLVQNAIDASAAGSPVYLDVGSDGVNGRVEVIDSGHGMSPEFVRNGLFKPFVSSKDGGFGIGAFEARELIRAMGGRLNVESRPELGTRFVVSIPLAATQGLIAQSNRIENEVA
ncbi:MAG: XrtA/PEP-CTERM system histidine kinase PrsK [Erythrobacter sp.]